MSDDPLACPDVAIAAKRSCTDKLCALLLFVFIALLFALLGFAVAEGDLRRITHGTDYNGNVCGTDEVPAGVGLSAETWKERKYLWFPFSYDTVSKEFRIASALGYGICVSDCNPPSGVVATYGGSEASSTNQTFEVFFDANEYFYRCVPDFTSFRCSSLPGPDIGLCEAAAKAANDNIKHDMHLDNFLFTFAGQVYRSLWITFLFYLVAVVLCYIWLILMRRIVKPFTVCILILAFCALVGISIALWVHWHQCNTDPALKDSDETRITIAFAVILSALTFIYLCVVLFLWKSIMMSCDVIEEGTRVIVDIPQITLVPVFTSIIIFAFVILYASIAVYLFTHGKLKMEKSDVELVGGLSTEVTFITYDRPMYVDVFQGYNLFMVLWLTGFQNAICYLVIAFAGCYWYFSAPGDAKSVSSPICSGFGIVYRYHIGTAAFGSFMMAIIAFARIMLKLLEKKLRTMGGENANRLCFLCICCAQCCLACLERIVKFFTEHGYVMTALTGKSLIPAATEGASLVVSTPAVLTINVISDVIIAISKWLIVLVVTLCGAFAYNNYAEWDANVVACVVMLFVGTWYIVSLFTGILSICIDTTLLCFAYDMRNHNGMDRPFYSPDDLRQYMQSVPPPKNFIAPQPAGEEFSGGHDMIAR